MVKARDLMRPMNFVLLTVAVLLAAGGVLLVSDADLIR
jgi:hypothetical protein